MSSMRNAVERRVHRERAQPASREKWGILEKHKDYSLRARDYNVKKAKLQRLREKGRERNPDEFAYGMMSESSKTQGKHGTRKGKSLSQETVKLLKTQDAGYLRVAGERVRRQLGQVAQQVRLQDSIRDAGGEGQGKVIFVDSLEDQRREVYGDKGELEDDDENEEEDDEEIDFAAQRKKEKRTRSKKEIAAEIKAREEIAEAKRLRKRATESRQKKLETLKLQHKDLMSAEQELDLQRGKMARSVGGVNKYGIKWKVRERKK